MVSDMCTLSAFEELISGIDSSIVVFSLEYDYR